jgi:hypothetical protein
MPQNKFCEPRRQQAARTPSANFAIRGGKKGSISGIPSNVFSGEAWKTGINAIN